MISGAPSIRPFTLHVEDSAIADLHARLEHIRWPDELEAEAWSYGADLTQLRRMTAYWREKFNWRAAEAGINALSQITANVADHDLHVIHQTGRGPNPLPLLICHGWPGSFVEMLDIIPLLADPSGHGGDAADAFDVIVPSMPGYGFSGRPTRPGMTPRTIAGLYTQLMAALGYLRYGLQGGDWGASVCTWIARQSPAAIRGIHLNWIPGSYQPMQVANAPFSTEEQAFQAAMAASAVSGTSTHAGIHASRPQTLGYGLNDSPAGLAAWLIDKFRMLADCDGDIESVISLDRLLTNVSVYWFSQTITSAIRLYKEARPEPLTFVAGERILPPLGFAAFPREVAVPPRGWVERVYNVERWSEMKRGGHFAAMEQPQALAEDIRAFFRPLRKE